MNNLRRFLNLAFEFKQICTITKLVNFMIGLDKFHDIVAVLHYKFQRQRFILR